MDLKAEKVKNHELNKEIEVLKQKMEHVANEVDKEKKMIQNERKNHERTQARLQELQNQQKIGGNIGSEGVSIDALIEKNKKLEQDNRILETQKKVVVVRNNELGTFEYIGEPINLAYDQNVVEPRSTAEVIIAMRRWLQRNDRLTIKLIFRSLDKANSGTLT